MAGIIVAITAIATMASAAAALSQTIQNAHYVNTLIQNISYTFQQQIAIDEKNDIRLNILESALLVMGDEVQTLKFRQDLLYHAGFQHICMTAVPYNTTNFPCDHIKAHAMGAWGNNNDSLNLQLLRQQILAIQRAHDKLFPLQI